jgi:hypothetical protein
LTDADIIGAAGAMFAVIAGTGLVVAAIAFLRRWTAIGDLPDEFTVGYNLLATQTPSQNF